MSELLKHDPEQVLDDGQLPTLPEAYEAYLVIQSTLEEQEAANELDPYWTDREEE